MKISLLLSGLIICGLLLTSCKNDPQENDDEKVSETSLEPAEPTRGDMRNAVRKNLKEGQQIFEGDFVYLSDAAVLTTGRDIYAVQIDDMMHELDGIAQPLKTEDYDMTNVLIVGRKIRNPLLDEIGEGWPEMVIIDSIIDVKKAKRSTVISGSSKTKTPAGA